MASPNWTIDQTSRRVAKIRAGWAYRDPTSSVVPVALSAATAATATAFRDPAGVFGDQVTRPHTGRVGVTLSEVPIPASG
ncbi:hypothetical protein GCM10022204_41660 [Microlunatus aurantiacus]|uniref:Uncharacterized protein n=1 Tax=Microlunatus aurantiacus TaxID=446786 RepID=A0ABP7ECQ9_9ACTN